MGFTSGSSTLSLAAQLPTSAILLLVLLGALRLVDSTSGRFVVGACWLRFMLSAYHEYTYSEVVSGISGNAIGSACLVGLGLFLLPRRLLLSRSVLAIYAAIATIILSAVANGIVKQAFEPLMKFGLLLVIALHCYEALRTGDRRRFGMGAILSFAPLLLFQLVSLILGVAKNSEDSDAQSYVGGYDHEAPFSVALVALLIVAALSRRAPRVWRVAAGALAIAGILLANYRTAIISMAPLLLYLLMTGLGRLFDRRMRPLVTSVVGAILVVVAAASIVTLERFSDLRTLATSTTPIIKPPNEFTVEEGNLLSGRTYLWSEYYFHWKDRGTSLQHLVGFGPDSWQNYFQIYAHNSFVDTLFEYGLLGIAALLFLFGSGIALALRCGDNRWKLLNAHLSFIILNLATMPMWQVEGLILYGLLWGYTMFYQAQSAAQARPVRRTPQLHAAAV